MPPVEDNGLTQPTAYWAFAAYDSHGQPKVSAPEEIYCRWELRQGVIYGDDNQPVAFDATVVVDRQITAHSLLRFGELDDVPTPPNQLYEVIGSSDIPDIREIEHEYGVRVRKFKKKLVLA